jgi:hypothetical protein
MATNLPVPAVITRGEHGVAANGALSPLLVTVEKVDREGLPLSQCFLKGGPERIVGVPDGCFPVTISASGDIEVDGKAAEILSPNMGLILECLIGHGVPPVQEGDACPEISESQGEIDDPVLLFEDGSATSNPGSMTVVP